MPVFLNQEFVFINLEFVFINTGSVFINHELVFINREFFVLATCALLLSLYVTCKIAIQLSLR